MSRNSLLIFAARLKALQTAIIDLSSGGESSVTFEGGSYCAANLPQLYALAERYGVKAAIEAVQNGAQSYTLDGLTYTRANLKDLVALDQQLSDRAVAGTRRGPGISYAVFG